MDIPAKTMKGETMITKNALTALAYLAEGTLSSRKRVTRQMIDRLSRDGLIDFDYQKSWHGWFLTEKGWAVLCPM